MDVVALRDQMVGVARFPCGREEEPGSSIYFYATRGSSREKRILAKPFAHVMGAIGILSTLTYSEFDCAALIAMLYGYR